MVPEKIVVDANILVSSLLKDSGTRRLLLNESMPKLFAPEFIEKELFKHLPEFAERLKVDETVLKKTLRELFDLARIKVVPLKEYSKFMQKAIETSPDPNDTPYFALALLLECPIWSQDAALKKQGTVKVYSTKDLIERIKKPERQDEFLNKIQQPKMRELWDNKEDEAWEKA